MNTAQIPIDLDQVLFHSIQAAKIAGKILIENFGKLKPSEIHNKTAFDFVTDVDRASESAIIEYLQHFYPGHTILAEESGATQHKSDFCWLIDPLDGTKNYIRSYPIFSVSIGLSYKNTIISGVIYAPFFKEMFTARKGGGAFLNDVPIKTSAMDMMSHGMLATGYPHGAKDYLDVYLKTFKSLFLQVSAIRRAGSAAIDMAYTACGRFDGFWEFKLNPWDIGAGVIIVEEAGGVVTDPFGGKNFLKTGDLVAATPIIHKKIIELIGPICEGKLGWN